MKPAGFDLIENVIIPPSPPGTFKVFAVVYESPEAGSGVVKLFLNKSAAEKLVAEILEYPPYPTAWFDQMIWRKEHPAGPGTHSSDTFRIREYEVVG